MDGTLGRERLRAVFRRSAGGRALARPRGRSRLGRADVDAHNILRRRRVRAARAWLGARERALGERLGDRGGGRSARVGLRRPRIRATHLTHRVLQCPLAASRRPARRDAWRDDRAVRQRPTRGLDASPMIETERLLLRKPRPEDAPDLAVAYADAEVVRFIGDGRTATLAEVEEGIAQWLERWSSWGMSLCSLERRETAASWDAPASSAGTPIGGRSAVTRP